jgi:tetratricopeptide (TPR) repeat protein
VASSADKLFQRALASLQAGTLTDAERLFRKFLDTQPRHSAGLNLIAVVLTRLGKFEDAERYIRRALNENAKSDATLNNYAIVLKALKRPNEALERFTQAIAINPSVAETWNGRGTVLSELGQHKEAIVDFDKAIFLNSRYADAYNNKAASLAKIQLFDQSFAAYNTALALNPSLPSAWVGRAKILFFLHKQYANAAEAYDKALALDPGLVDAWIGQGNLYYEFKRYDHALAAYDKALAIDPNLGDGWQGRGNVMYELHRYDEAIAAYDKLLIQQPAMAWLGRGNVYSDLDRDDEALSAFDTALALAPDLANAWVGRGLAFFRKNRDNEAIEQFEKAISLSPEYAEGYFDKAIVKLRLGQFDEGWRLYEWRWKTRIRSLSVRKFTQKLWLGEESIAGKTILVHSEQGLGDTIQFYRYLQKLQELDCKIIFETFVPLFRLFATQNPPFQVIARGDSIPEFDVYCPLMSLPLAFKSTVETIPAPIPYLVAPQNSREMWRTKLGRKTKPRIGLCWSGSVLSLNDIRRNIPLESLLTILGEDAEWHSLQKDVRERDRPFLNTNLNIIDHARDLNDFIDTAALISELDLIISIDAVAGHLAGALGKPLWSLQPFSCDFRWMSNRDDSPWYPTAKLFRQPRKGDWQDVTDRVRQELKLFTRAN